MNRKYLALIACVCLGLAFAAAYAALPQQFSTTRMQGSTSANQIDDKHSEAESAIADILGYPVDTNISNAAFVADASGVRELGLNCYAKANLPSADTAGRVTCLSDTDMADTLLFSDGSEWHPQEYYSLGWIILTDPTFGGDSTSTTNQTATSAALDRMAERVNNNDPACFVVPGERFAHTAESDYDPDQVAVGGAGTGTGAITLEFCMFGLVPGVSSLSVSGSWDTDSYLININDRDGSAGNVVNVRNMLFVGQNGGESLNSIFRCRSCVQVQVDNIFCFRLDEACLEFDGGPGNLAINTLQGTHSTTAKTEPGYIKLGNCSNCAVSTIWAESELNEGTNTDVGLVVIEQTVNNFTASGLRSSEGPIGYGINLIGFASLSACDTGCSIVGVELEIVTKRAINWTPTNSSDAGRAFISDVAAKADSMIAAQPDYCIVLSRQDGGVVTNFVCDGFETGVFIRGTGVKAAFGEVKNSVDGAEMSSCTRCKFLSLNIEASDDGVEASGTSGGDNLWKDITFFGTLPTQPYETANLGGSDRVVYAALTQTITIDDDGGGTVSTTINSSSRAEPHYGEVDVDCDDTSGGCRYEPATTDVQAGTVVSVRSSTSTTPVDLSVDSGTNCVELHNGTAAQGTIDITFGGSAWLLPIGSGASAC